MICERYAFGVLIQLGFGKWRHNSCEPGSQEWCAYFEKLPKAKRTPEGQMIYDRAKH